MQEEIHEKKQEEVWVIFGDREQYRASSLGKVQSRMKSGGRGIIIDNFQDCPQKAERTDNYGGSYYAVSASLTPKSSRTRVHVLICTIFHGPRPGSGYEVNHIDGDRSNNRADNLEWVTHAENMKNAKERNAWKQASIEAGVWKEIEQVLTVITQLNAGITPTEMSRRYATHYNVFSRIRYESKNSPAIFKLLGYLIDNPRQKKIDCFGGIPEEEWNLLLKKKSP